MTRGQRAIAIALAQEHGLTDLIPTPSNQQDDDDDGIQWTTTPTLNPGLDIQNGIIYMTFPMERRQWVAGKNKNQPPKEVISTDTICVTSERKRFWFDEETLQKQGWRFPRTFMQNPIDSKWHSLDIKNYLDNETDNPDAFELWRDIRSIYSEYIEFSEDSHYDLMSIYVMLTYVFKLFHAVPYIHFHGTREAGKSQNMAILNALAFNPLWQSSISPASLFRTLGGSAGTIMIDEAEHWDSEGDKEVLRILKAGYYDGAGVGRVEKDRNDRFVTLTYPAYSPKIIASINPQDATLTSRCIVINMRPAMRTLPNFDFRSDEYRPIRNRLHLFAMKQATAIGPLSTEWETTKRQKYVPALRNRHWQIAQPLLVLADYIGGDMLVEPLAKFLTDYWASQTRNANVVDRQALVLRSLPRVMRDKTYDHEFYYLGKDIHSIVAEYLDEEEAKMYKTRSVLRHLAPLGFNEKRNETKGVAVQIIEEDVRKAILQRRIEPFDEDVDWLAGNISYQRPQTALPNIWQSRDNDEETETG